MATAGGSYQIHIRVMAGRAARRLKGLQGQLAAIDNQVRSIPTAVMDDSSVTTAGTKRLRSHNAALKGYGTASASAAKGVRALNKASAGLGANLAAMNANTPNATKARQMKEYAGAMRAYGTASTKAASGASAFKSATKGMDVRLERISKALPEAAVGMELLDSAMKGSTSGWGVVNSGLNKAAPAMSAYAKATNAAAAAQERMNRASLGATKSRVAQDKPAAAVTRTGNVVRRSTAVQNSAAAATTTLTGAVHQNYEELAKSARSLAASTPSLTAFGRNAALGAQGVDTLAGANTRLATSITTLAAAQKKLNTAYAGAVAQPRQPVVPRTERVGNATRRANATAARAAVPNVDVQAMYGNLEGVGRVAATAEPQIDRLATSMERYAAAARLASTSTRTLSRHLGAVAATAPGAAGAMNVATDSAAKASLAAAAAGAGAVGAASGAAGREITEADKAMRGWSNTARTHGATMNWAGRQISMFFTLPLALAGGAAIKWQMDNEKAMTQVAKVYDGATTDIKNSLESIEAGGPHFQGSPLDRFFTALSSVMGQNKADIADIAADWAAVGLTGAQLASATQLTTEIMVLGDMEAAEATEALIAVQAQYGLSLGNLKQEQEALNAVQDGTATALQRQIVETESLVDVMATLNAVENATGATMPDLVRGFERTASVARQLGIDAQTLAAHMATLVPAMGTAERAGNALKTIYQSLASPRTERQVGAMEKLALNAGLAGDAFLNSQFLAEGMGKGIEEVAKAYSQLQGADRFTWARDVFGVYQYARGVQMLEDVSRGLGYQTDQQADHLRELSRQYLALGNGAEQAAFIADNFGIAASDMSDEAVQARAEFGRLLSDAEKIQSLSYYQKAGGGEGNLTSEDQLALYQRELDAVLSSNPHQFQVAMQVIKNAMADFIVPILPLIVAMTQEVAKLARWLGSLPPATQKLIALIMLTIAAFGPLIALFGTFFIASAMLSKGFSKLSGVFSLFRRDASGAVGAVGKLGKAIDQIKRKGGGFFGGLGGGRGWRPPGPTAGGGGGASAWPREDRNIRRAAAAVDELGDDSRDLARAAVPAAASLDAFTAAVLRDLHATRGAAGVRGAGAAADAAGGDRGRKGGGAGAAFAGAAAGGVGLPTGRKGKQIVDEAAKAQDAAAKVEKRGMRARLTEMLKFNKTTAATSAAGGRGIVGGLGRVLGGIVKVGLKPFGLIAKAATGLVSLLGGPIVALIGAAMAAVVGLMHAGGMSISDFFSSIFGNVGEIVREAMGDGDIPLLARPFVAGGQVIIDVVSRLPEIVTGAFVAIYNGVKKVAAKIWEVITNALNPFKRHSPSLVDNVLRGTSIIGGQYDALGRRVAGVMQAARADVQAFSAATAGLSMNVENIRLAENREKIATHAPGALPQFDALVAHQRELESAIEAMNPAIEAQQQVVDRAQRSVDAYDRTIEAMSRTVEMAERELDGLNRRLSEAQENFDRYANAQIAGLGAVDDAIFANELAQKRLQLALKKAGAEDMATTEDALSRIQGQMDDMAAKREALRLGGAGSEILSVYDQQLGGLAAQRTATMTGPTTEIQRMTEALEELQNQAEIMDLERALKFDPLNRQLDKMRTKTEEMSFERIASGMAIHGAQVDLYQGQIDRASAAIDRQREAITAVEDQRYLANQALDAEQLKLEEVTAAQSAMQEVLDEVSAALDTAIADADAMASELEKVKDEAASAADALDEFGDAADFGIPGGSFDPNEVLPSVEDMTQSLNERLEEMLGGISWGDMIPDINIDWGAVWDKILVGLRESVPTVSFLAGYLTGFALKFIGGIVAAIGWVFQQPGKLVNTIFQGIVDAIGSVDWGKVGEEGFMDPLSDLGIEIIKGIFVGGKNFIENTGNWFDEYIVQPFIAGFKKAFGIESPAKEMFPIGWDIIAGVFEGIRQKLETAGEWFGNLPTMISTALGNWWETGKTKASELWQGIADSWNTVVENTRAFGSDIWTKLKEGIGNLWETAKTWAQGFKDGVAEKWGEVTENARAFGSEIYAKIKEGLGSLWQLGVDSAKGFLEGLQSKASDAYNGAKNWARDTLGGMQEGAETHSPSRATMRIGRDVADGYMIGLQQRLNQVRSAGASLAAAAIPAAAPAPAPAEAATSPFAEIAADAELNLAQVQAITQGTADTTAAGYLGTMGAMRQTDLASQAAHATALATNSATMSATAIAQATTMATGVTSQAATMATGVTSAGATMASGVISAGATMEAGMNASMARMSSNVAGVINGQIAPVIGSIDPMLSTMTGWFSSSVNNVGSIWSGIGPRTADPARFVINEVYDTGLRGAWNSFNEFLDLKPLPSFRAAFKTGGVMPGYTPGRDVHQFVSPTGGRLELSGGEAIMRPEWTRAVGGPAAVARMNADARSGRLGHMSASARYHAKAGAFADGGVMSFAAGGIVGAMIGVVKQKYPQLTMTSGLDARPGYHGRGMATDWSNGNGNTPAQLALAHDIAKTYPGSQELIYDAPGWSGNINAGRNVGPFGQFYTLGQAGPHHHHVHWAMTVPPTLPFGGGVFMGGAEGSATMDYGAMIDDAFKSSFDKITDPGFGGAIGQWVPASIKKAKLAQDFMTKRAEEMNAFLGSIDDAAGAVERWRPMVIQALKRNGFDPSRRNQDLMLAQIRSESGGNPSILQQIQDVNSGGNEAMGLLQIIPGTFAAHRDPALPNDRTDPWANMNAALRYYKSRYGMDLGLMWGQGHGYDAGGVLQPTPGGYGTYYNHTGKPEMVLTNAQWRAIYRAASMGPQHIAAAASAAAAGVVEQLTANDHPWKMSILGEAEAIADAVKAEPVDPWEGFNSVLNTVNDIAQKAGTIGQAIITAQAETAEALAAADERVLAAATEASERAQAAQEGFAAAQAAKVSDEVAKVAEDTTAIATTVEGVAEDVAKVAEDTPKPELFTEAIARLSSDAEALFHAAVAEATGTIHASINSGDLQGGVAALHEQADRHAAEANRIAAETMTLLGQNLETVTAVVGAWQPVVDGVYELAKAIPDLETRRVDPWLGVPGGLPSFAQAAEGALTGIWNVSAELFNLVKNTLPAVVKHGVGIGSKLLNFVAENADAVGAIGVAIATGNIAAVLPFIPKILGAALELLPMIIQAIQEIVPALIKGIMDFFGSIFDFGGRAYSYASMEDATRAVQENTEAIRRGTFVAGQEPVKLEREQGGTMVVFNGDLSFPNVSNENDAKGFLSGVQSLSGRA